MDKILEQIVSWANGREEIRALILTSTRAGAGPTDAYSDWDTMVITDNPEPYLASADWMKDIYPVWVYQKESFTYDTYTIPTRLIIFKGNLKVDFSFWSTPLLKSFAKNGLSNDMDMGYMVLMDKDQLTANLPQPSKKGFVEPKPDRDTFLTLIYDFWFEVLGVAKYLKRNDVFYGKRIDNSVVKDLLLKMVIWNIQVKKNWQAKTHALGKKMNTWLDTETIDQLGKTHSGFNLEESWGSLFATIEYFRKQAKETASELGYTYPEETDNNISEYIKTLKP